MTGPSTGRSRDRTARTARWHRAPALRARADGPARRSDMLIVLRHGGEKAVAFGIDFVAVIVVLIIAGLPFAG